MGEFTVLFAAVRQGDNEALNRLLSLLYDDLRQLARNRIKRYARIPMLDTTALVHESYLRLVQSGRLDVNDRRHFLAYAATTMRSIIVDFARQRRAGKRGGDAIQITLNTGLAETSASSEEEIIRVNDALDALKETDDRLVKLVEMRYFGGLTETEIAEALDVTDRTVRRDWEKARLWLADALK